MGKPEESKTENECCHSARVDWGKKKKNKEKISDRFEWQDQQTMSLLVHLLQKVFHLILWKTAAKMCIVYKDIAQLCNVTCSWRVHRQRMFLCNYVICFTITNLNGVWNIKGGGGDGNNKVADEKKRKLEMHG